MILVTMSNEPSALAGCAVGHDGQLLDASQIQWFHDADDNTPLPQIPTLTSNAASSSSIKIRIPPPAARVAGQRRTERGLPAALRCLTERRNTIRAGKRRASSAGLSSQDESVSRDCFRASDSNRDDRDVFPMDTDTNLSDGVAITNMTDDDHTSSQMSATALGDTDRAVSLKSYSANGITDKRHIQAVVEAELHAQKANLLGRFTQDNKSDAMLE
ncbi:hypothetical protein EV363DRAFT_1430821 [Boletus edulis]|nr:hypothetical protein EV363DRAFT_1430821 [Boletus edulis]